MSVERAAEGGWVQVGHRDSGLPACLNLLECNGLGLGEEEIDLQSHRGEHDVGVPVRGRSPGLDVLILTR